MSRKHLTSKEYKILKKHLKRYEYITRNEYQLILYVVGKSKNSLTSQEIIKEIRDISSNNNKIKEKSPLKDVHRKIKELVPFRCILDDRTFLFDWNKFPKGDQSDNYDYNYHILKKLTQVLKGYNKELAEKYAWDLLECRLEDGKCQLNSAIKFEKVGEEILTVKYKSQRIVVDLAKLKFSHLVDGETKENKETKNNSTILLEHHLRIQERNNIKSIYLLQDYPYSKIYLSPILNEDAKKKNKHIAENYDRLKGYPERILVDPHNINIELWGKERDEVMDILTDSSFWKYTLHLNGLLFYLLCESKKDHNQDSEKKIIEVLSNNELIEKIPPFFRYWIDFNKVGFDLYSAIQNLCRDFETEIIREHNHNDDVYFILKFLDRCLSEVNTDLGSKLPLIFLQKFEKLNEYRKIILDYKELILKEELKRIGKAHEYLNRKKY